jgi:hypothetical protein
MGGNAIVKGQNIQTVDHTRHAQIAHHHVESAGRFNQPNGIFSGIRLRHLVTGALKKYRNISARR